MVKRRMLAANAKPRSELGLFLKFLRQRVGPAVHDLGPGARLPSRVGKPVTQQELAEAIGVSREWYAALESAATTRASIGLLERLADVLMITPQERARLFRLAVPEMGAVRLREDSTAVLEGFSCLRTLVKRLWTATSIEDVFATANDEIATWFNGALLVHTSRRREAGLWETQGVGGKHDPNVALNAIREFEDHILPTSELIDSAHLYPRLANAGDVGTDELHPPRIKREIVKLYARERLTGYTLICARVRSRSGIVGGLGVFHEFGYSYSPSDRAVLGAFAELTSFALS
jgi:transcriptional regulator with XRE-family HTH domain